MESIRFLQDIYEKLYALTVPIADMMEKEFQSINEWEWRTAFVDSYLQKKHSKKRGKCNNLKEIDLYYILDLLTEYWPEFRQKSKNPFFTQENYDLFLNKDNKKSVFYIRNEVSHPEQIQYTKNKRDIWNKQLEHAAEQLNTSISKLLENLHYDEKQKLLNFIFNRVCDPALVNDGVPEEIKKSVRNTKDRLRELKTASEVIAFFKDALRSERGQSIDKLFKERNLECFESISDELEDLYYGL